MRPASSLAAALVALLPLAGAGQATRVVRPPPVPIAGAPEEVARDAALRAIPLVPGSTLELEQVWNAPNQGRIVRLLQHHHGLPVQHAVVNVRLDGKGRAVRVVSSAVALPPGLPVTPIVAKADAIRIARNATPILQPARPGGRAWLVYTASGRLAWEVPVPSLLPLHAIVARVDALTGELLALVDRAKSVGEANTWPSAKVAFEARREDRTFDTSKLQRAPLAGLASTDPGATLNLMTDLSARLAGFNCCPTEGCDPAAPLAHRTGTFSQGGRGIPFDVVFCEERQTAVADAAGDFLHLPPGEPDPDPNVVGPQPSDGDTFAEVQAYSAAARMLAYMQRLDPAFDLGPNAKPARVTANFQIPDLEKLEFDATAGVFAGSYARFDNALFLPAESTRGIDLPIPGLERSFDSLILGQGTSSDFGYDDDVVAHELSHGTVNATARLADYAADDWGVLDAPGAMNEGFADYWAAALANDPAIGEYVGDFSGRGEGALRRLDNDLRCPAVIRGQVHQDSQHFSAALWAARAAVATTDTQRIEWDRGVLAAMRMLTQVPTFEDAAVVLRDEVEDAIAGAAAALDAEFAARGVTGCERVIEPGADGKISGLLLAPASGDRGWRSYAPGPLQLRLQAPAGATGLRLVAKLASAGGFDLANPFGGGDEPALSVLLKTGERLSFSYSVSDVQSDRELQADLDASGGGDPTVQLPYDAGCGATLFVALANRAEAPASLAELSIRWSVDEAKAAACAPPPAPADAGPGDGGGGDVAGGCGCGSGAPLGLGLVGLLGLRRRRGARG